MTVTVGLVNDSQAQDNVLSRAASKELLPALGESADI